MLIRFVRKLRDLCDWYVNRYQEKRWVPYSHDHNDKYCQHCGYICDRCGRPY